MDEQMDEQDEQTLLSALVDGELEPARKVRALRYLVEHPELLSVVENETKLQATARRVMLDATPATPNSVRQAVLRASFATSADPNGSASSNGDGAMRGVVRRRRWPSVATAAVIALVVGAWAGRAFRTPETLPVASTQLAGSPIDVTLVDALALEHVDCSNLALAQHSYPFPVRLGKLAKFIENDLRTDRPYPEFSSIGYALQGAGRCEPPQGQVVHLLYRSTNPTSQSQTLSLFVEPYSGQYQIETAKLYLLRGDTTQPMLVWRSDNVAYILVGNDLKTIAAAREQMVRERS